MIFPSDIINRFRLMRWPLMDANYLLARKKEIEDCVIKYDKNQSNICSTSAMKLN